jgi:hypothetical protein
MSVKMFGCGNVMLMQGVELTHPVIAALDIPLFCRQKRGKGK